MMSKHKLVSSLVSIWFCAFSVLATPDGMSPNRGIRLVRRYCDPGPLSSLASSIASNRENEEEVRAIANLLLRRENLLYGQAAEDTEVEEKISELLDDCRSLQEPGVYTNGIQYCLAWIRRDVLQRHLTRTCGTIVLENGSISNAVVRISEQFGLDSHESAACRKILSLEYVPDIGKYGKVVVVPENPIGRKESKSVMAKCLVEAMDECPCDTESYFSRMPRLVGLLGGYFATAGTDVDPRPVAVAYADLTRRYPHPGSLWVLGWLFEEFCDNELFSRFLGCLLENFEQEDVPIPADSPSWRVKVPMSLSARKEVEDLFGKCRFGKRSSASSVPVVLRKAFSP